MKRETKLYLVTAGDDMVGVMTFAEAIAWGFSQGNASIAIEPLN